jgi:ligand-binding SRPBCC domain-containing protein
LSTIHDCVGVAAPIDEVWAFFTTARNLESLTPPDQRLRVGEGGDAVISAGHRVQVSVMPLWPIRSGWTTLIEEVHPPGAHPSGEGRFTDIQLRGPFARWHHRHAFRPLPGGGTAITDEVEYALPLGALGRAVAGRWVSRQVADLFAYRKAALHQRFGSADLPDA